jgi:anhydro-N-acetylmuramic acid kinase
MDQNSSWALSGKIIPELLEELEQDAYFAEAPPKSTGRDYFNLAWLETKLADMETYQPNDIQATLLELSMRTIAQAIEKNFPQCDEVYLCGGGAHNPAMQNQLQTLLPNMNIATTAQLGIDPDAIEAISFAWLAYCRMNNIPIALQSITGATQTVMAGAVYSCNA